MGTVVGVSVHVEVARPCVSETYPNKLTLVLTITRLTSMEVGNPILSTVFCLSPQLHCLQNPEPKLCVIQVHDGDFYLLY